jgi:hypothetical protein
MCDSTCFGRFPHHYQEHATALGASGFTVGEKRLELCWSWSGRPRPTTLQLLLSNGKTRGFYYSCILLMMGWKTSETCWTTHKRQVINLWNCCILLVELFESYDDAQTCERQKYNTKSHGTLMSEKLHRVSSFAHTYRSICVFTWYVCDSSRITERIIIKSNIWHWNMSTLTNIRQN